MSAKKTCQEVESGHLPPEIFRLVVEQADLAISITDTEANILYANPAFAAVTGYPRDEVVGKNESILSNRTTPRSVYDALWAALRNGAPWGGRLLNRRRDGSEYLAEVAITPVAGADGKINHYLGMHRDISAVYELERRARNQKSLLESVVDAAPMVFALLDGDGRVLLDNHEYKKLLTDLDQPQPAHTLLDACLPDWRQTLASDPAACRFAGREVGIFRAGRSPRWFACTTLVIAISDERADGFFGGADQLGLLLVAVDVTHLRNEQERARTAALKALLAEEERVVSIRESLSAALFRLEEPMNLMASAVSILQRRDEAGADVVRQALAAAREQFEDLRQSIPRPVSEGEVGVNLNEVLRDVLEIATPRLLSTGIVVDWRPAVTLPNVPGRPLQLRVMFKALLDNAIEALDARGLPRREIRVTTAVLAGAVQASIDDSGPGIPDELRLKVFEPFFSKKQGSGCGQHLGTGLSRAQQVAAEHGGLIELGDSPLGGCAVRVELPQG